METIIENEVRVGKFTSSQISKLIGNGYRPMTEEELKQRPKSGTGSKTTKIADPSILSDTALTYIEEKNFERKLGRSLSSETGAHSTTWGKCVEQRVFDLLGTEYSIQSQESQEHPTLGEFWVGSPDLIKHTTPKTVAEIKCPFTLKSFCQFAECKTIEDVRVKHPSGEDYYWQIVSNAIITGSQLGELIVYCPKQSELDAIRELASDTGFEGFKWIFFSLDYDVPFLPENSLYESMYIFKFEIPEEDKQKLTERVVAASKLLIANELFNQ